jgi:two-component system chemotaxis response regulator CheY
MHALAVDDSRAHRLVLSHCMKELGYKVTEATNGLEGLQRLDQGDKFDVLLVDWQMPMMDGLEFIRRVRAKPEVSGVPIIVVSSTDSTDAVMEALEAGANEYIIKPFTKEVLAAKLDLLGVEHR